MDVIVGALLILWFIQLMWRIFLHAEVTKIPKGEDPQWPPYMRRSTPYAARQGRKAAHRAEDDWGW